MWNTSKSKSKLTLEKKGPSESKVLVEFHVLNIKDCRVEDGGRKGENKLKLIEMKKGCNHFQIIGRLNINI